MKRFSRILAVAFAASAIATAAAAQEPILNKVDLQRLVAAETPVARLRLVLHFNALADRYREEAEAHTATAATFKATANRSAAVTAGDRFTLLAARATESAAAARQLAAYHASAATGGSVPLPAGAAAMQGGLGAREPSADELRRLSRLSRSRGDHLVLEEYYGILARRKAAESADHRGRATAYRAGLHKGLYDAGVNDDRLARVAHLEARRAQQSANLHRQLANIA